MNYSKIPHREFPSIHEFPIRNMDEPLVNLREYGFLIQPIYYNEGLNGAVKDQYARESVGIKLAAAQKLLPKGYRIKVFDAYRPISVQQSLWDKYRRQVIEENKTLSEDEIDKKTGFYVSKPSTDVLCPSLHNTGGAVDVTIIDPDGNELNMGTGFDDFTKRAWTDHFEYYEEDKEVRNNRRLLYYVMKEAGFTNLPSEWWHYDFGTKFWGYFKGYDALYTGILDFKL